MPPTKLPTTLRERTVMPRTMPRCRTILKPVTSFVVETIMGKAQLDTGDRSRKKHGPSFCQAPEGQGEKPRGFRIVRAWRRPPRRSVLSDEPSPRPIRDNQRYFAPRLFHRPISDGGERFRSESFLG